MASHTVNRENSSSSDSDVSEWAVVDEDSSLEWNDEEKYHFRQSNANSYHPSNDASDEDSIEVVSDVDVNEDEEQSNENCKMPDSINVADDHASEDMESSSNMVLYQLNDSVSVKSLAPAETLTAVNRRDNWDLIAILVVALIGGVALGYFWGLHHEHTITTETLTARLQLENNLLRHKVRRMSLSLKHHSSMPSPEHTHLQELNDSPVNQLLRQHFPTNEANTLPLNLHRADSSSHISVEDERQNIDLDDEVLVSVEDERQKIGLVNEDDLHLTETIANVLSLISAAANFSVQSNHSLALSFHILDTIGQNLQEINLIQLDEMPPKLHAKFYSIKDKTHRASKKLVIKINKHVNKVTSKIFKILHKFHSNGIKNVCNLKQIVETENDSVFVWPKELALDCEVNRRKKNSSDEKYIQEDQESSVQGKSSKTKEKSTIHSMKLKAKRIIYKETSRSAKVVNVRRRDGDDFFSVDKTSNVSGDWIIEMAKGRAEKREIDHQSDWLFERAQARKCHRDNLKNKQAHFNGKMHDTNGQILEEDVDISERPQKKFRKFIKMLHNIIPESLVERMRSFKSGFKVKNRSD